MRSKHPTILISTLLGLMCFVHGGSISTHAQSPSASAISLTAEDYFDRGMRAWGDEKIADLTQAIQLNPNYSEAYFERAKAKTPARGKNEPADLAASISDYTQAIQLNPKYTVAYYRRGNVYAHFDNRQAALADYNQAIQLASDDPEFYYDRGLLRDQLDDQQGATADYLQVVRLAPSEVTERADNQRVIEQFTQLISQSPNFAHVYYRGLAHLYITSADPDAERRPYPSEKTYKDLTEAIQLNPYFADAYYYRGLSSSEGIQDFTKAIQLNPTFSDAYFERGLARIRQISHTDEIDVHVRQNAIKDFSQAISFNPNYARAYYYRGRMYSLGLDDSKALRDYAQALRIDSRTYPYDPDVLRDYLQALEAFPNQSMDYYRRGIVRRHFGDNSGAIADFNQVIRLDPKFAKAYYYRGLVSYDKNKKRKDFTQAIQLDPNFTEAYLERGLTYASGISLTEGFDDFSAAIRIKPNLAYAFYLRSEAHRKGCSSSTSCPSAAEEERARQKELEDLTQAIRLNPDFPQAFCSARPWGDGGWGCNRLDQVPERYIQIIRFNPNHHWGQYPISELIQYEQETVQRLVRQSTQAIQSDRQNADAHYKRGIAYLKLEQLTAAITDLTVAIQLNVQDAEAYSNRGFAYYRLKCYEAAIADYTQVIQLNPRFANAYFLRGLIHYDMGNHQPALADMTQAIRFDPTLFTAYIIRSRTRLALGDREGAKVDLKIGLQSLPSLQQAAGGAAVAGGGKSNAYYDRGVSLARRGDKQAAIRTLQQAANLFRSQGNMPRYQATLIVIRRLQ
jgi:tetratricopeptide (TPR) repeat protein